MKAYREEKRKFKICMYQSKRKVNEEFVWKMKSDRIAKRVYVGECAGSCSVDKPWKRWIDTVKDCLRKGGLDVR